MLGLMHDGALLLDEVDLILHPLKSELNWPLGPKEPLDFTRGRKVRRMWFSRVRATFKSKCLERGDGTQGAAGRDTRQEGA